MATLRDIKRKISSVNSTQTITRTMKMVSASKLKKAEGALERVKSYAWGLDALTKRVISKVPQDMHPLLTEREEVKKVLLISIGSDRGLCGGFNMNIGLHAENFVAENKAAFERIGVYVFGRKVRDYLVRRKVDVVREWTDVKSVDWPMVDSMATEITTLFNEGEFDKVYLTYTRFVSPVKQVVAFEEFLPIRASGDSDGLDYLYEPDRKKIVEALIYRYIGIKLYYALVESQTAEHAARMAAMENATSNCGEMIRYLTLIYNKRRQESITSEMMDIVGGAEALRGT
jgi:F-type H+-transporting ATPase subunit gamma